MRCSLVIISSYVRMLRTSFAENASHGLDERANAERASSEERASKGSPFQDALLRATRRVVVLHRHIDAMAILLLRGRRNVGRHVVTRDVPYDGLYAGDDRIRAVEELVQGDVRRR